MIHRKLAGEIAFLVMIIESGAVAESETHYIRTIIEARAEIWNVNYSCNHASYIMPQNIISEPHNSVLDQFVGARYVSSLAYVI